MYARCVLNARLDNVLIVNQGNRYTTYEGSIYYCPKRATNQTSNEVIPEFSLLGSGFWQVGTDGMNTSKIPSIPPNMPE